MRERAAVIHALRHWRPYLVGREFLLRTDHRPNLKLAQGGGNVYDTPTDEIQQFQPFTMEYLPGKKMFVDALSRKPPPNSVNTVTDNPLPKFPSDQDLAKIQQQDPILGPALALHRKLPIKSNPEAEALTKITFPMGGTWPFRIQQSHLMFTILRYLPMLQKGNIFIMQKEKIVREFEQ